MSAISILKSFTDCRQMAVMGKSDIYSNHSSCSDSFSALSDLALRWFA